MTFEYFLYCLRANKDKAHDSPVSALEFFSESRMKNMLNFYSQVKEGKIVLIKEQERGIGFSYFLALYIFYRANYNQVDIAWICDASGSKKYFDYVRHLALLLQDMHNKIAVPNKIAKKIEIGKSKIVFLSDTTYQMANRDGEKYDLVIFDDAKVHNYSKLETFLENVIQNLIADKVILNFNPAEDTSVIETDFEGKLNIINYLNRK